ncbi:PDZ domain-containing protein [Virgibacillus xinjiangensis]|uniref:PDZ domain-containing protein n=1 Tax=Virgibacillus xinjiangensis TaxID=393090 RepID=A0ABV7CYR8_9BACI
MLQDWLYEGLAAIGRVFLHPITYWAVVLVVIAGYNRIKRERREFGVKVFHLFTEWKGTWRVAFGASLFISVLGLGAGMVFQLETLFLLGAITILLSLPWRFTLLSPAYSLGITSLVLLLSPIVASFFIDGQLGWLQQANLSGLVLLLGLLLVAEASLVRRAGQESFPRLVPGKRGGWTGEHQLKKMSIIPFFALVPSGQITSFADFWPYFSIGGETYSIVLVPFLLGFHYGVRSRVPQHAANHLSRATLLLAIFVLLLATGSIYEPWLAFAAIAAAIIGREFISYRHRMVERKGQPYFRKLDDGIRVLGVIKDSPADRIDIHPGETVRKVNGRKVNTEESFYQALQGSGAYFKLEVLDASGEIRFVQGALYEGDHHELGIVLLNDPHKEK